MTSDRVASKQPLKKPKPGDARLPSRPSKDLPSCSAAASRLLFDLSPVELIDITSSVLEQAVSFNKSILGGHKQHGLEITRFHTRDPPAISIKAYLTRLLQLGPFPLDALLLAAVYINRLTHRQLAQSSTSRNFRTLFQRCTSPFQEPVQPASISPKSAKVFPPLTPWTVHRLLLGALAIAAKYTSDAYIGQKRLAKVGGITIEELSELELEMFRFLSWSCYTSALELEGVCSEIWQASGQDKHNVDTAVHKHCFPDGSDSLRIDRLSLFQEHQQQQTITPTLAMSDGDGGSGSSGLPSSPNNSGIPQIGHSGYSHQGNQKFRAVAPALVPLPK